MQDSLYYQEELSILRDLAAEFSREYPALAPMLAATGTDPDVERVLEGAAYLSSFVKQRLDDEFPEIVQGLLQHIYPHYLRPIPSATLVSFSSSAAGVVARRGVELRSVNVEDSVCRFTTAAACRILPFTIERVEVERQGEAQASLTISFSSTVPLDTVDLSSFSIFVTGPYADAVNAHRFVLDHADRITVTAGGGAKAPAITLPATALTPGGYGDDEALLPWPARSFRCYRLLQEYYTLPEKFLHWRLSGLENWTGRGASTRFSVRFGLKGIPGRMPEFTKESFLLNVVPAVNIFPHSAEPIRLDHQRREYPVSPQGYGEENCLVYSVRRVGSRNPIDNVNRNYLPLEDVMTGRPTVPVYAVYRRRSEGARGVRTTMAVQWPGNQMPVGEIMSVDLLCTNADLPALLRVGDVRIQSDSSPSGSSFTNILPPTAMVYPPLGRGILWRLLSYFNLNLTSLTNKGALAKLLGLHVFQDSRDRQRVEANLRKVAAVRDCASRSTDRLIRGVPFRGRSVEVTLDRSGFAAYGDMRIFGEILEHLFAEYASMNCFTECRITDSETGDSWQSRPRLGMTHLV